MCAANRRSPQADDDVVVLDLQLPAETFAWPLAVTPLPPLFEEAAPHRSEPRPLV